MPPFDPAMYKINSKANWNSVAFQYHHGWANDKVGPFKSTEEIVRVAEIAPSDRVLDIACGTGAVSKEVMSHLGKDGFLTGVDFSRGALKIARQSVGSKNASFFEMDAENMEFCTTFNKIFCQYALMFFPDAKKVLKTARRMLVKDGLIALAVHGTADEVPYFSSIMSPILRHIPDIRPSDAPTVHRFGKSADLQKVILESGFSEIKISRHVFSYEPGTFEEYWRDYMRSTANSIRPKIDGAPSHVIRSIKSESEQNTSQYIYRGKITFPWTVLIASARG